MDRVERNYKKGLQSLESSQQSKSVEKGLTKYLINGSYSVLVNFFA